MYHHHHDGVNPLIGDAFKDSFVLRETHGRLLQAPARNSPPDRADPQVEGDEKLSDDNIREQRDLIERVRYWSLLEIPPAARSQREVEENCQGWCLRVVERLVEDGFVEKRWIWSLRGMMQAVK